MLQDFDYCYVHLLRRQCVSLHNLDQPDNQLLHQLVPSAVSEPSCSVDDRANEKNRRNSYSQRVAARARGDGGLL